MDFDRRRSGPCSQIISKIERIFQKIKYKVNKISTPYKLC